MPRVAIIGCGQAGTAIFTETVRKAVEEGIKGLEISIFNKLPEGVEPTEENIRKYFGPGFPYGIDQIDGLKLAHEFTYMGAININNPNAGLDDLYNWVQGNIEQLKPLYPEHDLSDKTIYPPRSLYGRYLIGRYQETKIFAEQNGIKVTEKPYQVDELSDDLSRKLSKVSYVNDSGLEIDEQYDQAVICTGHTVKQENKVIAKPDRYFAPYPPEKYTSNPAVKTDSAIVILGTGQTAVDAALALIDSGHTNITMASRGGLIRAVRGKYEPYSRNHLTIENLEKASGKGNSFRLLDIFTLLNKDFEEAYGHPVDWPSLIAPKDTKKWLEDRIKEAESGKPIIWRSVLSSLSDIRQTLFERMDEGDKKEFVNGFYNTFFTFQAPMPLPSAKKLYQAIEEGKISVSGGLQTLEWDKTLRKYKLQFVTDRSASVLHDPNLSVPDNALKIIHADFIVEARGQERDLTKVPLLNKMFLGDPPGSGRGQLAEQSPFGGLLVNPKTRKLVVKGNDSANISVIGPVVMGTILICNNALENVRAARIVAGEIISTLKSRLFGLTGSEMLEKQWVAGGKT